MNKVLLRCRAVAGDGSKSSIVYKYVQECLQKYYLNCTAIFADKTLKDFLFCFILYFVREALYYRQSTPTTRPLLVLSSGTLLIYWLIYLFEHKRAHRRYSWTLYDE